MTGASLTRHIPAVLRRVRIVYGVGVVVAAVVIVFALNSVYGFLNSSTTSSGALRTSTVALGTVQSSVSASGNVSAATSASVGFGTSGTLTAVDVAVGDRVKAGQVLAKIDPATAQTTLEAAQANLAQAQSALTTAQGGLTATQKASNASSLLSSESQLASAKQQLSASKVTLAAARQKLKTDLLLSCPAPGSSAAGASSSNSASNSSSAGSSAATTATTATTGSAASSGASGSSASSGTGGSGASSGASGSGASSGTGGSAASSGGSRSTTSAAVSLVHALNAPAVPPVVSTGAASNIATSTATLSGSVNPEGDDTSYRFQYGLSSGGVLTFGTTSLDAGSGSSPVSVSMDVSGLQPGQIYLFRIVAENSSGTTDGAEMTVTTLVAAAPTVTTASANGVGLTSVTLGGTVNSNAADTSYHFEYGTTKAFGSQTAAVDAGSGTTASQVSTFVTGLRLGTTYVFRLVATNASGTTTGLTQVFTTATAVTVATAAASSVTAVGATLNGTVSPQGADTTYHFEYGTSASSLGSTTSTLDAGAGNSSVPVSITVTGLKPGTTYHFRLDATNVNGAASGTEETLITPAALAPTVTSGSASATGSSMTLSGTVNPNASDTHYYFEYGTADPLKGRTVSVDAGSGATAAQVSAVVSGLKLGTTYGFRLVATNAYGTVVGFTQTGSTPTTVCVTDAATVTADELAVAQQEQTVKSAVTSLNSTKATIATSLKPSATTIAQDDVAVKQAEATVVTDQKALEATTLTSPLGGTVTALNGSVGTTVSSTGSSVSRGAASAAAAASSAAGSGGGGASSSSSGFATIDSLNKLEIVSGFAEADATKLAAGQPAVITFPALPTTQVAGRVVSVSSTSTVVSNVVTYPVTIVLINSPSVVKEGMTANVSVITKTRSHVLELPTAAITTVGTASTVSLLSNGKTTVTPITTGLVGTSSTEIVSGLSEGAVVVVPTVAIAAATATTSTGGTGGFGGGGGGGGFGGGGGGFTRGG